MYHHSLVFVVKINVRKCPNLAVILCRYAFVGFPTVDDAEKALKSSQNMKLCKKTIRVQFCNTRAKQQDAEPSKTLIVVGLSEKTTAEVLKSAFDGAVSARIPVDKATGASQRSVTSISDVTVACSYLLLCFSTFCSVMYQSGLVSLTLRATKAPEPPEKPWRTVR